MFSRPQRESSETRYERIAHQRKHSVAQGGVMVGGTGDARPKEDAVTSEPYRRLVAALPCIHCCIVGISQAAHPNTGKGAGLKTDDRKCFPLCADTPGRRGCHAQFDQGALFSKDRRRELEPLWGAQTRAVIAGMGNWPRSVPEWGDA